jgi:hypothetical protein
LGHFTSIPVVDEQWIGIRAASPLFEVAYFDRKLTRRSVAAEHVAMMGAGDRVGTCSGKQTCNDGRCAAPKVALGDACSPDAGILCQTGLDCIRHGELLSFPGGYCSKYCSDPNTCGCPSGSHASAKYFMCVKDCANPSDCRSGYQCTDFDQDSKKECVPLPN